MGQPAARIGDFVLQDAPHCHANIHPALPVPTPSAHPALPLAIVPGGNATVLIGGQPAACVGDQTVECVLPGCSPGGPGVIAQGSPTVTIGGRAVARLGDMTQHPACIAPIPSPVGKVIGPGCPTVLIG